MHSPLVGSHEPGLTASCASANEVMSVFSASVNSPFGPDESILDDIGVLADAEPSFP